MNNVNKVYNFYGGIDEISKVITWRPYWNCGYSHCPLRYTTVPCLRTPQDTITEWTGKESGGHTSTHMLESLVVASLLTASIT